ncbi:MAG: hypothetical protein Ct9H300mP1_03040 [Planctomycetaceae bacterium]|nr:MAG: hypothetical protein Ct9H300mP1_03040 [Planctomycetaceae bacterium]
MPEIFLDRDQGEAVRTVQGFTLIEGRGGTRVIAWIPVTASVSASSGKTDHPHQALRCLRRVRVDVLVEVEQQYVIYLRYAIKVSPPTPGIQSPIRPRMSSKDLLNWTKPDRCPSARSGCCPRPPLQQPDDALLPGTTIYVALSNRLAQTRPALREPRGEAQALAKRCRRPPEMADRDCADTVMLTTRASAHYDRLFMEGSCDRDRGPRTGPRFPKYTLRGLHPTSPRRCPSGSPSQRPDQLHVRGSSSGPTAWLRSRPLRRGTWSPGRCVSRQVPADQLRHSAVGGLRVEIQNDEGKPTQGSPWPIAPR